MKKKLKSQSTMLLIFLGIFGFSVGLFDNYRELWMSANHITTTSISRVISFSYIVTVLALLFFTVRVSTDKLKIGILVTLILKLMTGTVLICLNQTNQFFWIKFFMFFDIAFNQLIVSSIYPFLMNIKKDDVIYAKKSVVESLSGKLGFLLVSILLGKVLYGQVVDYNLCFLFSQFFTFLSFLILLMVTPESKKTNTAFDLKKTVKYFKTNKIFLFFLLVSTFSTIIWNSILGMPMLTLTQKLHMSSSTASFLLLGLGILSNILSMIIVKYFKFKNDHVNLFFKFGARILFYIAVFFTGNEFIFLLGLIYLLLTDCTHNFIFTSFFINKIDEEYSLVLTTLKYCASLLGNSIGVFFCGLVFEWEVKYFVVPALLFSVMHYFCSSVLVRKKRQMIAEEKSDIHGFA